MEEPRKPFKTISLEDKLRASQYNTLPTKPLQDTVPTNLPTIGKIPLTQDKASEAIRIPKTQFELPKEGVVISNIMEVGSKEAIVLKTLTQSPQSQIQPPLKFITSPLINSIIPQARVRFASSISLRDRLAQTSVTKTTHLPQYFLSDLYTGYLVIPPFLTALIENTQSIGSIPTPVDSVIILSRQDANVVIQTPTNTAQITISQGTTFANGQFISNTTIARTPDTNTILIRQGTTFSNNTFNSVVETSAPTPPSDVNQGFVELPVLNSIINQGQAGDLSTPLSVNGIAILQGLTINQGAISDSVIVINSEPVVGTLDSSPTPNIATQFTTPLIANYPRQPLSIIRYQTDKLLAFGAPRIKHGSAILFIERYLQNRTRAINDPVGLHGGVLPTPTPQIDPAEKANQSPNNLSETDVQQVNLDSTPQIDKDQVFDPIKSGPIAAALGADNLNTIQSLATRYASLNYGKLVPNRGARRTSGAANSARGAVFSDPLSGAVRPTAQEGSFKDFITIKVGDIQFTAYLTSYSDSVSAAWNDLKYVGRQDTLKQFTGATRSVSFAILLPSLTKSDLAINMRKLEQVLGLTVVGSFKQGNSYITGPIPKVQVGNLLNAYCAFSSVKWDFDPSEATFDIDEQMPHLLKVSFDAAVLSTNKGKLLNGTEGGYFGKSF